MYCDRVSDWLEALRSLSEVIKSSDTDLEARLDDAKGVEGCVARAIVGELDPTGELALGRYPPILIPGAGAWLAKKGKYDSHDPASRDALASAVRRTLGVGWLLGSELDAHVVEGRDERDIFNIWAPGFRDPPRNVIGKDNESALHRAGSDVFVGALKEAGMARFLGGSKISQIGYVISGGGLLLRVIQSSFMDEDEFTKSALMWAQLIEEDSLGRGRWAWDNFGL